MSAADLLDGRAHAVVANPPYIVCTDKELNVLYRARYVSASRKFGLGAPFTERLYQLVVPEGYHAQITANAFMKREYGKALIEKVLPRLSLTHVLDTGGCAIPGHGTPTCILAGRGYGVPPGHVFVVQGKRGAPETPPSGRPCAVWESFGPSRRREHPALGTTHDYPLEGPRLADDFVAVWKKQTKARAFPTGLVPWAIACAVLLAFQARGLVRRLADESLPEALLRLDGLLAESDDREDGPGAWLGTLAKSGLPEETGAQLRAVFGALEPPAGPESPRAMGRTWSTVDTDWLGDLYQALDARANKLDALAQTPWWVRDALLDLAVQPAARRFGLAGLRVLDPTCGTGHLLCGAFWHLFALHIDALDHTVFGAANLALASCEGVELTAMTAWLARVRLTLAWLDATGAGRARPSQDEDDLGRVAFKIPAPRVEQGDSLLEGVECPSPPPLRHQPSPPSPAPPQDAVPQAGATSPRQGSLFGQPASPRRSRKAAVAGRP